MAYRRVEVPDGGERGRGREAEHGAGERGLAEGHDGREGLEDG